MLLLALCWACFTMSCDLVLQNLGVDTDTPAVVSPHLCASEHLQVELFTLHLPPPLGQLKLSVTLTEGKLFLEDLA